MTLRLRLVLAVLALLVVGLGLFGVATYSLYARSEYDRLDQQVRGSVALVTTQLTEAAGLAGDGGGPGAGDGGGPGAGDASAGPAAPHGGRPGRDRGGPSVVVPPGTYAELRDSSGTVLSQIQLSATAAQPSLPATLKVDANRIFTTEATSGPERFRVLATGGGPPGVVVVVALPLTEVTNALRRLVLIEGIAAVLLLLALSVGSWLVLRRGLRPLEEMAATARSITAGDLSQRVSPSGGPGEVEQLGLALNTMLDDIEAAFLERDATERRLRQFLADASHELRTPLTSIQGFAELFRLGGANAAVDLPTILRRIEQESGRMRGLVEDLLLLARLDETRPAEREPVDLAVLAADACSDAVATAPDRRITLDAPLPVVVAGDQAHLRQAIANLVTNALRHTPDGSPIEVTAALDGARAEVRVRDHGPGLDGEALSHVFDRFWQADSARVGTGAGLGLAIVAGIAAEHGGQATAANTPDGGAVFTVTLPVSVPAHAEARAR